MIMQVDSLELVLSCCVCLCVVQDLWGDVEISWNHVEFEVRYESLFEEIKIGECRLSCSFNAVMTTIMTVCRRGLLPEATAR